MILPSLVALLVLGQAPGQDSVYGVVRDAMTGTPVPGARVSASGGRRDARADRTGAYVITGLATQDRLRFARLGYDSMVVEVVVPAGQSLRLDVDLHPIPVVLPPFEVTASDGATGAALGALGAPDSAEIGLRRITVASLATGPPATEGDPFRAVAQDASAGSQSELPSALHIRGGSSDQNLILLDGIPLYGAMHLGGLAGIVNPDAIESVALHSAVQPASVTGRLSGAIEIRLRGDHPEQPHTQGAWTPTTVRQLFEAPLLHGQGSALLSVRRSYRGIFGQDVGDGQPSNGFSDWLLRGAAGRGRNHLAVYLLRSTDRVAFPALLPSSDPAGTSPSNRFQWSTGTEAVVWQHRGGVGRFLTGRVWHAGAGADIDWFPSVGPEHLTSRLRAVGANLEFVLEGRRSRHLVGVEIQRLDVAYDIRPQYLTGMPSPPRAAVRFTSAPTMLSGFVEERVSLGSRWMLTSGLHATSLNGTPPDFDPRISVRYRLSARASLLAGYSRVHQYLQSLRNEESPIDRVFGAELPVAVGAAGLQPARSDQLSGALEVRLAAASTLRLDGYVRWLSNLVAMPTVTAAPFAHGLLQGGTGRAGGLQLELVHRTPALDLTMVLGAAHTERQAGTVEFAAGAQSSRWVTLGGGYALDGLTALRLGGSLAAGAPASLLRGGLDWQPAGWLGAGGELAGSPEQVFGAYNRAHLPLYSRIDLGLERRWPVGLLGRFGVLTTSVAVTNLLNRRNTMGFVADSATATRRALYYPPRALSLQLRWQF